MLARTIGTVLLTAAALGLACLAPTGCAARGGSASGAAQDASNPAWRARTRERALLVLGEAAMGDNALLRANAIEGLKPVPQRGRRLVIRGLSDPNLGVRFTAAKLAGDLELAEAASPLRDLLQDESPSVRAAAIYALRRIGEPVDPTPLASMLAGGDVRARSQAAFILGELGDPSAIPMLKEAASRPAPNARQVEIRLFNLQVAEALAKLGDEEAVEAVRAALYPSRPEELEAAALAIQIIGEVGDRRSIDQLIYMAERDPNQSAGGMNQTMPAEIRLAAAASLARLGLPRGDFIADEYDENDLPAIRAQAAFVYGRVGNASSLRRLADMLEDPSPLVRVAAAAAIVEALAEDGG